MKDSDLEKQIQKIIQYLSDKKGFICSIDILLQLGYLSQTDFMDWRYGKVEYLEKVCKINLSKLSTLNRIMKQTAIKMKLKPSWTAYNRYGKGVKQRLRFSKSGDEKIEIAYATHWINEYQMNKLRQLKTLTDDCKSTCS